MAPPCTCADTKELSTMFILSCAAFMNHKSEPKMCMRHMKAHCPRPVVPQQVCSRYAMLRERHRRGALACALCASILGWCFVAPRTETRPMPRCPVRAAAGETKSGSNFWGAAQKAAGNNKTDVEAYIAETKTRAGQHMNSSQVVDRDEAVKALVQSMESTGLLSKNLGKTFLKQAALRACSSNVVVVSADMRDMPGTSLLNAILLTANKTLKERTGDNDVGQYRWLGIISAAVLTIEGLGPAASPAGAFIKDMAGIATSRRKVRSGAALPCGRQPYWLQAALLLQLTIHALNEKKDISHPKRADKTPDRQNAVQNQCKGLVSAFGGERLFFPRLK